MRNEKKGNKTGMFIFLCIILFIISFVGGVIFKLVYDPFHGKYKVNWTDEVGKIYSDISYGELESNKFDLYVPSDNSKESYGLIVYLHAGGFRTGDKKDDADTLKYYVSKGYVTAGINYTLNTDDNPQYNIKTMSEEIKKAIPIVVNKAKEFGYNIDEMTIAGGSAGGCLALIYAYRDAKEAPVPVRMVFEGVGPSSFYPEDWKSYGLDKDSKAAADIFSYMTGKKITEDMFGTKEYDELIKDVSALLWVDENTVPTVMAYGKHDIFQPYEGSVRLDEALTAAGVDHKYFVLEHSGHGLQNDTKEYMKYLDTVEEYLNKYMPVK